MADDLQTITGQSRSWEQMRKAHREPALTILYHPDLGRVGERVRLPQLEAVGARVGVGRNEPLFVPPYGDRGVALDTPFVSRKPIQIRALPGGDLELSAAETKTALEVGSQRVVAGLPIPRRALDTGVVMTLGGQVVLLLHAVRQERPERLPSFGLVGDSDGIDDVRERIAEVAPLDGPVLIRGETGSGKELVARGIHTASARSERAFVTLNLGAVPPSIAAAELFGHVEGAFSGARQSNEGYFGRADGGTLFLDEVGETPDEVQPLLLRALETGEVQKLGARALRKVDVRLVAATDADLEARIEQGSFRAPLLYRLASHEVLLPPLRERRDDIGRLLRHFLLDELAKVGRVSLVRRAKTEHPWLPGKLVARLVDFPWPGNVRQLRNVARFLASVKTDLAPDDPRLDRLLSGRGWSGWSMPVARPRPGSALSRTLPQPAPPARSADATDEQLLALMRAHDYRLRPVSEALGMSRPALNDRIDRHPTLKRARHLEADEIEACLARCGGDVEQAWRELEVSEHSLKVRMKELGLR